MLAKTDSGIGFANVTNDGIINRKTYAVVPPKVEYSLSAKGKELKPIIDLMKEFGNKYKDKK